jgi:hypothetical protein
VKQKLINEITALLQKAPIVTNLSRQKFVAQFVVALIKSRKIQFCEIAQHLNDDIKMASNETRIQDFFREVTIDFKTLATVLLSLLPKEVKLRICIDRTEWNFGKCEVNILMILIGYGNFQVPFYWEFLDNKSGNSSTQNRIDLLLSVLELVEPHRIGMIVADREFVGHKWFKFLKDKQLNFLTRLPKHHQITQSSGEVMRIDELNLGIKKEIIFKNCLVDGVWGNVQVIRLSDDDYLYLFGTVKPEIMGQLYRKRWSIESCFQNLKGRGFGLSKTHLRDFNRLSKLLALVSLAYSLCLSVGLYFHKKVQAIKLKRHGYKSHSFARHGLDQLRQLIRHGQYKSTQVWSCLQVAFRWVRCQLAHYQDLKIVG